MFIKLDPFPNFWGENKEIIPFIQQIARVLVTAHPFLAWQPLNLGGMYSLRVGARNSFFHGWSTYPPPRATSPPRKGLIRPAISGGSKVRGVRGVGCFSHNFVEHISCGDFTTNPMGTEPSLDIHDPPVIPGEDRCERNP